MSLALALTALVGDVFAQDGRSAIESGASYTGDVVNNLRGGIKTGSAYLGMATINLGIDTEKAGLWKGGNFYVMGANTHGDTPSANLIGDMQVVSNIEAGNHTYIQELWFKQRAGSLEFTLGLQDLAVEFGGVEYGGLYLNSSFGVKSSISHNIPVPIFPLTNLGFTAKWDVSDRFVWLGAIFDGQPEDFDTNPYNIKWKMGRGDGFLAATEFQASFDSETGPAVYKAGAIWHRMKQDGTYADIASVYANANRQLWSAGEKAFGLFAQLGYSPSKGSTCEYYVGLGMNYSGLLSRKGRDEAGLAVAHESFRSGLKAETAIEMTYKYRVWSNFYLQPDVQYIINPAGTGTNLADSFCVGLRFGLSL